MKLNLFITGLNWRIGEEDDADVEKTRAYEEAIRITFLLPLLPILQCKFLKGTPFPGGHVRHPLPRILESRNGRLHGVHGRLSGAQMRHLSRGFSMDPPEVGHLDWPTTPLRSSSRPPPPPPTLHNSGGSPMGGVMDSHLKPIPTLRPAEEEGNSEMTGGNCIHVNGRTRLYYFRKCKRNWLKTNIDSLPDDIMFNILLQLPAQDIYDATRLVCQKWYRMIYSRNFIYAHLQHSTCGLLIQNMHDKRRHPIFMAMRQGRIEISRLRYEFGHFIWSSCNGLMLECDIQNIDTLYITNPATKQHFSLPPFFCRTVPGYSAIAYAAASMEYKVIRTYFPKDENSESRGCCSVLTLGVDNSWRRVRTEHLSREAKSNLYDIPLITEGFVHWPEKGTYVLTLNVETEVITQIPVPQRYVVGFGWYYFSTLRYLSLLIACNNFSWEVWEMKPETGEWTKLPNIDLEAQNCTVEQLCCKHDSSFKVDGFLNCKFRPVGWLKYQEVFIFQVYKAFVSRFSDPTRFHIAYNVGTQKIDLFEFDSVSYHVVVHRNNLLWLDG
ncbi:hypothetical protein DH2020_023144 [Rehmannia glutinosa]|uniref:F-box domain-containing protein n=1 Tax=Rehmannia glutinosa TaxID=99300 RepID=A0ABR0W7S4_REHGL